MFQQLAPHAAPPEAYKPRHKGATRGASPVKRDKMDVSAAESDSFLTDSWKNPPRLPRLGYRRRSDHAPTYELTETHSFSHGF